MIFINREDRAWPLIPHFAHYLDKNIYQWLPQNFETVLWAFCLFSSKKYIRLSGALTHYASLSSTNFNLIELGWQTMAPHHIQPTAIFWMAHKLRTLFTYLKVEKKIKRWVIFYDTWKLHVTQISVCVNIYWNLALFICWHGVYGIIYYLALCRSHGGRQEQGSKGDN